MSENEKRPGKRRLLFLHIPKNAGTAILRDPAINEGFEITGTGHCLSWERARDGVPDLWDDENVVKLAVVRNPWERLVSLFRYAQSAESFHHGRCGTKRFGIHPDYLTVRGKSFGECLALLREDREHERDPEILLVGRRIPRRAELRELTSGRGTGVGPGIRFGAAWSLSVLRKVFYLLRRFLFDRFVFRLRRTSRLPRGVGKVLAFPLAIIVALCDLLGVWCNQAERAVVRKHPSLRLRNLLHPGWRDQHPYVYDPESASLVVQVARHESLQEDLSQILEIDVSLKKVNVTPDRIPVTLSAADVPGLRCLVEEDCRILDYPVDPPESLVERA